MSAGLHSTSSTLAFLRTASSLTYHSNAFNCIRLEFPWEMTKQVMGEMPVSHRSRKPFVAIRKSLPWSYDGFNHDDVNHLLQPPRNRQARTSLHHFGWHGVPWTSSFGFVSKGFPN